MPFFVYINIIKIIVNLSQRDMIFDEYWTNIVAKDMGRQV